MVNERRAEREEHVREAADDAARPSSTKVDIPADISGRAKHFYSIYDKMAKKGREFNEIYDLTAMRVIVERAGDEGTRDCYGALGLIHSLWKPMPGRFKDYVAMPKLNGYRALHTTVIGPEGRAARDPGAHARDARSRPSTGSPRTGSTSAARRQDVRRRVERVGAAAHGHRSGRGRPARVHEDVPHGPVRRRGATSSRRRAR